MSFTPVDILPRQQLELGLIHESVVKVTSEDSITKGPNLGTAFFIHIPNSPYEVILTAGHNLFAHGKPLKNVTALLPDPNPTSALVVAVQVPPEHIKISAGYLNDPTKPEFNYGAILIPYTGRKPRRGLGFKITHAFSELRGEANISSHNGASYPGRPRLSSGTVSNSNSTENRLAYQSRTELMAGNMGAPVWIIYDDNEVAVVAIHNQNPTSTSKECYGARISTKLLWEVFVWAGLDTRTGSKLKAQSISNNNPIALPPTGLYTVFGSKPFARLQRGTGSDFILLPGQVMSSTARYALAFGGKWVMFDIDNQQVVLVGKPNDRCLFTQELPKNANANTDVFCIALEGNYRLRMDGSKFKPFDLPDAQTSGLSMVTDRSPFIHFAFEPSQSLAANSY